jgi:rod shape-determining protein MreD
MLRLHKYIIHFIILVLVQLLIINNIQVNSYINPFIYILLILLLPFDINKSLLLIIGFFTGLSIDIFSDTFGIHAAASTLLAFARPGLLSFISARDAYEPGSCPSINIYGFSWFIKYLIVGTLIHHTCLFFLEVFSFNDILHTLGKIFTNIISSVSAMLFYYIITSSHKKTKR